MYKQEQIKPYEGTGDKGKLVEEMFDNIAPTYDTLNHRLSWDIDKGWRKKAIKRLAPFSPKKMLDIATGTGDFAILAARMLHPDKLIGADISQGMNAEMSSLLQYSAHFAQALVQVLEVADAEGGSYCIKCIVFV